MALNDSIRFGMSLPHRSVDPIPAAVVRDVAQRAEALGFARPLGDEQHHRRGRLFRLVDAARLRRCSDHDDPARRLDAGAADVSPGSRRAAGRDAGSAERGTRDLGRRPRSVEEYDVFQVPAARRVTRFNQSVELIRALWAGPHARTRASSSEARRHARDPAAANGRTHRSGSAVITRPRYDRARQWPTGGWEPAGRASASLAEAVPLLHAALADAGRDPAGFPISKRVFLSVHDRREVARVGSG